MACFTTEFCLRSKRFQRAKSYFPVSGRSRASAKKEVAGRGGERKEAFPNEQISHAFFASLRADALLAGHGFLGKIAWRAKWESAKGGRHELKLQIHVNRTPRAKDFKNIATNSFCNYWGTFVNNNKKVQLTFRRWRLFRQMKMASAS